MADGLAARGEYSDAGLARRERRELRAPGALSRKRLRWLISDRSDGVFRMVLLFAATLLLSSTLVFLVQPMVGKMILPALGGTPAVWNTCMVFFQAALLAGYAYAHATVSYLGVRRQARVHLAVLILPLAVLPIRLAGGSGPPPEAMPVFWLLTQLLVAVGLPFFVITTTAPLLQKWFADTRHPSAKDPYFLYAASNCGSLLALLSYPLLVEPALALTEQSWVWTGGYAVMVLMIAVCAIAMWRSPRAEAECGEGLSRPADASLRANGSGDAGRLRVHPKTLKTDRLEASPTRVLGCTLTMGQRGRWLVLAAVPSSLMLGVTTHVTTNLAAVPLLWVVPLMLYLLTFVLVFARKPLIPHVWMVRCLPLVVIPAGLLIFFEPPLLRWDSIALHMVAFFVVAMVCHGELVRQRPSVRHLTEFYLWMSAGGVLGGSFNAIVAPLVFSRLAEYPLMLVAACVLLPRVRTVRDTVRDRWLDLGLPALLALGAAASAGILLVTALKGTMSALVLMCFPLLGFCFWFRHRPVRLGLTFGVILATSGWFIHVGEGRSRHVERNFFGVKEVMLDEKRGLCKLIHGNINHGSQSTAPARSREPLTYYHRTGPLGDVFAALNGTEQAANVAVIGLGIGSAACYAEPGQHFVFYEIDPAVARIAGDPDYFTFLAECRGTYEVVLGDGRLTLAKALDRHFGLIMLDAFSSDAIPTHLLSREALEVYVAKLADGGLLAFHISNRYLDLEPLLANLARDAGLIALSRTDFEIDEAERLGGKYPSHYVVMARQADDAAKLSANPSWRRAVGGDGVPVWTDQYCNILKLFRTNRSTTLARK